MLKLKKKVMKSSSSKDYTRRMLLTAQILVKDMAWKNESILKKINKKFNIIQAEQLKNSAKTSLFFHIKTGFYCC